MLRCGLPACAGISTSASLVVLTERRELWQQVAQRRAQVHGAAVDAQGRWDDPQRRAHRQAGTVVASGHRRWLDEHGSDGIHGSERTQVSKRFGGRRRASLASGPRGMGASLA
jgi:hypothetical protein